MSSQIACSVVTKSEFSYLCVTLKGVFSDVLHMTGAGKYAVKVFILLWLAAALAGSLRETALAGSLRDRFGILAGKRLQHATHRIMK